MELFLFLLLAAALAGGFMWGHLKDRRVAITEHVFAEPRLRERFEAARHGLAPDKRLSPADEDRWAVIEADLVCDADLRTVLTDLNRRVARRTRT